MSRDPTGGRITTGACTCDPHNMGMRVDCPFHGRATAGGQFGELVKKLEDAMGDKELPSVLAVEQIPPAALICVECHEAPVGVRGARCAKCVAYLRAIDDQCPSEDGATGYRCDLRAGHGGIHSADDERSTAMWSDRVTAEGSAKREYWDTTGKSHPASVGCEHCDGERSPLVRIDRLRGHVCPPCDVILDEMYPPRRATASACICAEPAWCPKHGYERASASDSPWPDQDIVATALGLEEPRMDLGHILKRIEVLRSGSRPTENTCFVCGEPTKCAREHYHWHETKAQELRAATPCASQEQTQGDSARAGSAGDAAASTPAPLADRKPGESAIPKESAVMPQTGTTGVGVASDAGPRGTSGRSSGVDRKRAILLLGAELARDHGFMRATLQTIADVRRETIDNCAAIAAEIAELMENGAGETKPGERLRQVERMIRAGLTKGVGRGSK